MGLYDSLRIESSDEEDLQHQRERSIFRKVVVGLLLVSFVIAAGASGAAIATGGEVQHYIPEFFATLHWQPPHLASSTTPVAAETTQNEVPEEVVDDAQATEQNNTTLSFRRDPQDYVLQRNWNFTAPPTAREYNWTISEAYINPDGVYRHMYLINSLYPGPAIEAITGDTIRVNIHNALSHPTSFHWHGIFHNGTNHMDGTVGFTQCPIPPGGNFTYEFSTEGQYGTYWYHSHLGAQYVDGLFGPLVIHSAEEPAEREEYDSDRVVMLHDHYHDLTEELVPTYLAPDNENAEPIPDGALINGRNVVNCDQFPQRRCDNSTAGSGLASLELEKGKKHRVRFINVGGFAEFEVQLDGHMLPVVEVDGSSTQKADYHKLMINVAQRYSVILSPPENTTDDVFWLRARMVEHCFASPKANLTSEVNAVMRYTNTTTLPTTSPWNDQISLTCTDLNSSSLLMASPELIPAATTRIFLRSNFEIGAWKLSRGYFNTSSWRTNLQSPVLNRLASLPSPPAPGSYPASINVTTYNDTALAPMTQSDKSEGLLVAVRDGEVVDLLIDNFDDGNHPFHLHGHKFWILAQGHGYFNESHYQALQNITGEAVERVVKRDTVTVEAFGWVLIRWVAGNRGVWAMHCHNVWHAEAGLSMGFAVGEDFSVPDDVKELCLPAK